MTDCIAIVSGGMDSVTLLHYLVKKENRSPAVMTFSYGQKHTKEIEFAKYQTEQLGILTHQIIDLSLLTPVFASSALVSAEIAIPNIEVVKGDPQPVTYVPNRNMIFLSIAAAFAETLSVEGVFYGAQAHDLYGYWDTTPDFLQSINSVLGLNRKSRIQVMAPLVHLSKAGVLKLGVDLAVDFEKTWSCYEGGEMACGICPTCAERLEAFKELGMKDPLPYIRR